MTIDMTELEAMERELDTMAEMTSSNGDLAQEVAVLGALRELGLRAGRMQRARLSRLRGRLGVKPADRIEPVCNFLGASKGGPIICGLNRGHVGMHSWQG